MQALYYDITMLFTTATSAGDNLKQTRGGGGGEGRRRGGGGPTVDL